MSHPSQIKIMSALSSGILCHAKDLNVIEIGSHVVNGEIRSMFSAAQKYTGIDLVEGLGVDEVGSGHDYGKTGTYDVSIACEVLEHNPFWKETVDNMVRITKPGGLVIITCASRGRLEHGTNRTNPNESPGTTATGWSYYKNIYKTEFEREISLKLLFTDYKICYVKSCSDLYFIGEKRATPTRQETSVMKGWLNKDGSHIFIRTTNQIIEDTKPGFLKILALTPVTCASFILTDRYYQNVALPYFKMIKNIVKIKNRWTR